MMPLKPERRLRTLMFTPTLTLRDALNRIWRWPGDQFGEPSKVLSDGGKNKLILGASRAAESKPVEPKDALEVCKPHLAFLAFTSRLFEALRANERPGHVSGALMDVARDFA